MDNKYGYEEKKQLPDAMIHHFQHARDSDDESCD